MTRLDDTENQVEKKKPKVDFRKFFSPNMDAGQSKELADLVVDFVVETNQAFSIVNSSSFMALVRLDGNGGRVLHDFLFSVCENGIGLLVDGPVQSKSAVLEEIGRRIGLIQPTHFGNEFEVTTKPEAGNMAYASGEALPYHTDFPSLSQPPELQMLHMVQPAEEGGLSTFVDGFKIAELMEKEHPELYKILTSTPVEYIEEGFDIHTGQNGQNFKFEFDMVARHKVFSLNDMDKVMKVQFGNAMRSWYFDCEPKDVQKIYDALKMFTDYCYQPENQLIFPLKKGETVLWANTRLLHGRTAYKSAANHERMVIGCYFMWDIVKSRIRLLRDRLGLPQNQLSV